MCGYVSCLCFLLCVCAPVLGDYGRKQDTRSDEGNEKDGLGVVGWEKVWENRIRGQDVVVGGGERRSQGDVKQGLKDRHLIESIPQACVFLYKQ